MGVLIFKVDNNNHTELKEGDNDRRTKEREGGGGLSEWRRE